MKSTVVDESLSSNKTNVLFQRILQDFKIKVMLGRLAARDNHDKRPFKPQIYQGRGRGQNRNFNQRNYQDRNRLNNRSSSRDRGQFRDRPRSEQN